MDDQTQNTNPEEVTPEVSLSIETMSSGEPLTVSSLESLINRYIASIEKLRTELKENNNMFNSTFDNDAVYRELAEKAKEATKNKTALKQQMMKQPATAMLADKLKNMKEELKDLQLSLSDYLQEYQRLANTNLIEGTDGEMREIIKVFKLIKKSGQNRP
ncbi:hypothetical protein HGB07_03440 [Candidatus Roizmanbacteria bacterium]|nr:hypothetical protein [Candidatus Roizmanbacteria bacterium]